MRARSLLSFNSARTLPSAYVIRWLKWFGLAVYVGLNVGLILYDVRPGNFDRDWAIWNAIPRALVTGTLYDLGTEIPFAWSPVMAPVMAVASMMGIWAWAVLHLAVLILLRTPAIIGLTFVSWGFWTDLASGNVFVFVFVAAFLALRGSRRWALAYIALLFVMPRPVQLPLALWLVWKMPEIRLPTLLIFALHAATVVATGYGADWLRVMASLGAVEWNIGPSHWLGLWWLAIGIPLGAGLLWRRHPGWAGLAWSSYWIPAYFLLPLVEIHAPGRNNTTAEAPRRR